MAEFIRVAAKKPEDKRENKASQTQKTGPSQSISSTVQRILFLQRTIGNHAVCRLLKSGALQGKLKIGKPGDIYGQEADRVAEQVMRMPEPQARQPEEKKKKLPQRFNGKTSCSPDWYGDTSPEIDESTGKFTGKVIVKYNTAALKDPCVRDCVEQHETVHVKQLTPVVTKIHECDMAAGNDRKQIEECNAMANRELNEPLHKWECEAYQKSFTCLTLKILDAKNPCSKPPHFEVIQKHRGYESCEMKKHCKEAGTPEAGIPVS